MSAHSDGLHTCLPTANDFVASADFVTVPFQDTVSLSAKELTGLTDGYRVVSHDPLSVTLRWRLGATPESLGGAGSSGSASRTVDSEEAKKADTADTADTANTAGDVPSMSTPLVRGMPYVSAFYRQLTPSISFGSAALLAVNGRAPPAVLSGTRFQLALSSGQVRAKLPLRFAPPKRWRPHLCTSHHT